MRIVYVVPSRERRGPNIFVKNLINGISLVRNLEVEVVYLKSKGDLQYPVPSKQFRLGLLRELCSADVVQSTMFLPDLVLRFLPLGRAKKISALHNFIVDDMQYSYPRPLADLIAFVWLGVLRGFKNLIFSSDYMERYYRKYSVRGSATCIDYGIPESEPSSIEERDLELFADLRRRGLKIVGDVCLLIPRKGVDQLVSVLAENPNIAVVLVGDGPVRSEIEALATKLQVADRFFILGFRNNSHRYNVHFDVFAMVSRSEGFCMAMLEAMAAAVPIVCSSLPIYEGFFAPGDVESFELEDIKSLNAAIQRVLSDLSGYSQRSGELFQRRFSLEAMARAHLNYYDSILSV